MKSSVPASETSSQVRAAAIADASVAVVIVNYRTPQLTKASLAALQLEKALLPKLRAIIVDGGSADGSATELAKTVAHPDYAPWVSFLPLAINGGFGWANNQAILTLAREASPPEYIHLLNPDTEVLSGAVARLVEDLAAHPRCGAAGSQVLTADRQPTPSAFRFPSLGREFVSAAQSETLGRLLGIARTAVKTDESVEVDWVTGASVMCRTDALREVGLFDDGFFLYFEEVELLHRLRAMGWTVRHVPESRVIHLEGAATGVGKGARERPPYWYQSRRRYFALTGGRASVLAVNWTWLAGAAIGMAKRILGRPYAGAGDRVRSLFRFGFWATRKDVTPSAPAWGDAPGKPPAWMSNK